MNNTLPILTNEFREGLHAFVEVLWKEHSTCDKCHEPVEPQNSAVLFDFIVSGMSMEFAAFVAANRHLESIVGADGIVMCEGSPSRWQGISGIDIRNIGAEQGDPNEYSQAIWQIMQQEFAPEHHEDEKRLNS